VGAGEVADDRVERIVVCDAEASTASGDGVSAGTSTVGAGAGLAATGGAGWSGCG
jgi:hypothetical protein